jgi:hypothetical protein
MDVAALEEVAPECQSDPVGVTKINYPAKPVD